MEIMCCDDNLKPPTVTTLVHLANKTLKRLGEVAHLQPRGPLVQVNVLKTSIRFWHHQSEFVAD